MRPKQFAHVGTVLRDELHGQIVPVITDSRIGAAPQEQVYHFPVPAGRSDVEGRPLVQPAGLNVGSGV